MHWTTKLLTAAIMITVWAAVVSTLRKEVRETARLKARVAADAGALAGASALLEFYDDEVEARKRAIETVRSNSTARFPLTVRDNEIAIDIDEGRLTVQRLGEAARTDSVKACISWAGGPWLTGLTDRRDRAGCIGPGGFAVDSLEDAFTVRVTATTASIDGAIANSAFELVPGTLQPVR